MRWDRLFDDLEGQLEQGISAEERDLAAEEERLRIGRLSIRDRLAALSAVRGRDPSWSVRVQLTTGLTVAFRPTTFGRDWISGDLPESPTGAQCVLPVSGIAGLRLTASQVRDTLSPAFPSRPGVPDRLGIGFVLRDLCRRRAALELHTTLGVLHGTVDRVGRDHLDLAEHEPAVQRRSSAVSGYRTVALSTVVMVRL